MTTQSQKNEDLRVQKLHLQQRRALNNAYASLEADRNIQTFSAFTFEDAVDLQIEDIEGDTTGKLRPNRLERVDRIEGELIKAVELLKQVPPELFLEPDEALDVNTPQT